MKDYTVILANGEFPSHSEALKCLRLARRVVCCDGAIKKLDSYGIIPEIIIGDMDSLSHILREKYRALLVQVSEQETNDLTKAVHWCHSQNYTHIIILGATGKREDHTLGNISLLADYNRLVNAVMVTDYGKFRVIYQSATFHSCQGQKISIFSFDRSQKISSEGLLYPLHEMSLQSLWNATLNTVISDTFTLVLSTDSPVLVYFAYA